MNLFTMSTIIHTAGRFLAAAAGPDFFMRVARQRPLLSFVWHINGCLGAEFSLVLGHTVGQLVTILVNDGICIILFHCTVVV